MKTYSPFVRPGYVEVFTGTMKSGKSRELLHRLDQLSYVGDVEFLLVKPALDTRTAGVFSREGTEIPCLRVDCAARIVEHVRDAHRVVAIDEAQFFDEALPDVVLSLAYAGLHVLVAGLDLNFRGEPFGPMPRLLSFASRVHKLAAVCAHPGCENIAILPQRLTNGKPAHYDAPEIAIEGAEEYEPRCLHHHVVPGKPDKRYAVRDQSLGTFEKDTTK